MDQRLTEALAAANYAITIQEQRNAAYQKLQDELQLAINGGQFEITRELISFTAALRQASTSETTVVLDKFNNPIRVELESFFETIVHRYHEATFEYLTRVEKIRSSRSVESIIKNA